MVTLVYIHGANATGTSWNYLRSLVPATSEYVLEYSCSNKFEDNLQAMSKEITNLDKVFYVGHSLGGIYAYHLANKGLARCVGGLSISTPFGGVSSAYLLGLLFPFYSLFQDIKPNSKAITSIRGLKNNRNWTQIVTRRGNNPLINGKNDGVITVSSQQQIDCRKIVMEFSHNEILQSPEVAGLIISLSGLNLTT